MFGPSAVGTHAPCQLGLPYSRKKVVGCGPREGEWTASTISAACTASGRWSASENEPPFHARVGGGGRRDHARGTRGAASTTSTSSATGSSAWIPRTTWARRYFEHWLDGIARVLAEKGVVDAGGARGAHRGSSASGPRRPAERRRRAAAAAGAAAGRRPEAEHPVRAPAAAPPRFAVGDAVVDAQRRIRPATRGCRATRAASAA